MSLKVCMFVYNNCTNDARVLKEAATLIAGGYKVKIIALKDKNTKYFELRDGIEIFRVDKNPIHYRIMSGESFRNLFKRKKQISFEILRNDSAKIEASRKSNIEDKNTNGLRGLTLKEFFASFSNELKTKTLRFIAYRWFVFLVVGLGKTFKIVIYVTLFKLFRSFSMIFHRQLCFYDFHRRSYKLNNTEASDIYHAHDMNTLYAAYKSAKLSNAKFIYDSHELYIERNKTKKPKKLYKSLSRRFEKKYIRKADKVITVGEFIAIYLRDLYKIPQPEVIMNAPSVNKVNIEGKNLRDELDIPSNLKLIIYCGGITFNRGLEKLIESFTLLPNMYLIFMGYGKPEYLKKLKSIAEKNKVSDRFSFYGPVAPTEVTAYTASADLGVAPIENVCLSYYYCAPNKVFEYLIGGIPVISSDFPELKKIVTDNEIGYTFDPQNINSIADSIKNVFSDEKKYLKMKKNTTFAAKKYNWENEANKLLNLYKEIS